MSKEGTESLSLRLPTSQIQHPFSFKSFLDINYLAKQKNQKQ